jgi:hypothetical protein
MIRSVRHALCAMRYALCTRRSSLCTIHHSLYTDFIGRYSPYTGHYSPYTESMGAIGFDRDARYKEACRVTAYPYPSGTKHKRRLSRVLTSSLALLRHPDFLPASSPSMASFKQDSLFWTPVQKDETFGLGLRETCQRVSNSLRLKH